MKAERDSHSLMDNLIFDPPKRYHDKRPRPEATAKCILFLYKNGEAFKRSISN